MLNSFALYLDDLWNRFHDWGYGTTPEPELPIPEVRTVTELSAKYNLIALSETSTQTNGGVKCDMAVGPCACGSWHQGHTGPAGPSAGTTGPTKQEKPRKSVMKLRKTSNAGKSYISGIDST